MGILDLDPQIASRVGWGLCVTAAVLFVAVVYLWKRRSAPILAIVALDAVSTLTLGLGLYLVWGGSAGESEVASGGGAATEPLEVASAPPSTSVAQPAPEPIAPEALYETYCFQCHGERGNGDGPLAASLPVGPANILEHLDHHTEEDLVRIIRSGIPPAMPPAPLEEEDARRLVLYLQSLAL